MGASIMPRILFAVDEHNHPKILKVVLDKDEHFDIPVEDITEIESSTIVNDEDYSLGVYKGSLTWVDTTSYYPEYEVDGYWVISEDFELLADLTDEL